MWVGLWWGSIWFLIHFSILISKYSFLHSWQLSGTSQENTKMALEIITLQFSPFSDFMLVATSMGTQGELWAMSLQTERDCPVSSIKATYFPLKSNVYQWRRSFMNNLYCLFPKLTCRLKRVHLCSSHFPYGKNRSVILDPFEFLVTLWENA